MYKINDLVKINNNTKINKLDAALKGLAKIIDIRVFSYVNDKVTTLHVDQVMPYFTDDGEPDIINYYYDIDGHSSDKDLTNFK